ncbi:MAG: BamA/OMP85 family outer membrane protein, partial [Myxococcota bacterium]
EISSILGLAVDAPFDREGLERGLARVSQLLRKRRHLAATAEIVAVTYDEERRVATVEVRVDAGPRYRVDYVGNYVISNATLHTLVDESSMSGQDSASLDNAREKIRAHYERAGFARAQVYVEDVPAYGPWKATAERVLRFYVDEGPRVEIEEVIVEGSLERDGRSLAADVWSFVYAETPTGDLIQPLELADLEEVFGKSPGPTPRGRPLEEPDVIWRPFTWPLLLPQVERKPLYTPGLFEAARQRMLDQYRKDGFLQASITAPDLLWVDGGRRLRVRYRVNEGNQTHIAGVRFEPPPPVPIIDLLAGATLQPGSPADLYAIEQMRLSLESNLREHGYPFATVTEELKPVGTDSIDVLYRLTPGTQVTVAGIRFRGQEQTREFLLRDRMRLGVGDLYAASEVDESRQRLLRTGLFTSVNIGFLDDREGTARRVLLVDVVERPRYSIEAGAGGSLEDGPRAFSTVEVRNLFGAGVGLRGRGQINYPRALYGLYFDSDDLTSPLRRFDDYPDTYRWALFTEGQFIATAEIPKLYGLPSDVRLHMDTVGLREIRPAFTLMKGSLASGIDLQPFPWLHLAPQLELETSDFDCPSLSTGQSCNEGAPGLTRRVDAGTIGQLTLHLGTTLDARDDPFRPHSGVLVSVNSDVAIGDGVLRASDSSAAGPVISRFWKLLGTVSTYVPLAADATLALTVRAGNIFPLSPDPSTNYIPLFKRFYLGGTNSVRGYNFDALLPVDDERWPSSQRGPIFPSEQQLISLGGNFLLNGRAELRKTLVGDLEFGLFTDTGQLATVMEAASLFGFAIGAGAGLRYLTPVGPVVLDLAAKVIDGQRRLPPFDDLSRYNLHLSIGYF